MRIEHTGQRVLAIDPGVKYLGWALGQGGLITQTGYTEGIEDCRFLHGLCDVCIIEKPQQYASSAARRADITDLTLAAGEIKAYVSAPQTLLWEPREWKGQVPKPIHQARILIKLRPCEVAILPLRKMQRGHVLDACGIALRFMGRL